MRTDTVRARIEPKVKTHVHSLFRKMGITPTQAIRMFYYYVDRANGFPFDLYIPNEETAKAIHEARTETKLIESKNLDELFNDLDI